MAPLPAVIPTEGPPPTVIPTERSEWRNLTDSTTATERRGREKGAVLFSGVQPEVIAHVYAPRSTLR